MLPAWLKIFKRSKNPYQADLAKFQKLVNEVSVDPKLWVAMYEPMLVELIRVNRYFKGRETVLVDRVAAELPLVIRRAKHSLMQQGKASNVDNFTHNNHVKNFSLCAVYISLTLASAISRYEMSLEVTEKGRTRSFPVIPFTFNASEPGALTILRRDRPLPISVIGIDIYYRLIASPRIHEWLYKHTDWMLVSVQELLNTGDLGKLFKFKTVNFFLDPFAEDPGDTRGGLTEPSVVREASKTTKPTVAIQKEVKTIASPPPKQKGPHEDGAANRAPFAPPPSDNEIEAREMDEFNALLESRRPQPEDISREESAPEANSTIPKKASVIDFSPGIEAVDSIKEALSIRGDSDESMSETDRFEEYRLSLPEELQEKPDLVTDFIDWCKDVLASGQCNDSLVGVYYIRYQDTYLAGVDLSCALDHFAFADYDELTDEGLVEVVKVLWSNLERDARWLKSPGQILGDSKLVVEGEKREACFFDIGEVESAVVSDKKYTP